MIDPVFDQPGARFVFLAPGEKYPPLEKAWQTIRHDYDAANKHPGNIGVVAGDGFVGLDQDDPSAFANLKLPETTVWETRPGRIGMWFMADIEDIIAMLQSLQKKPDQAQLYLFRDGVQVGELKLQRSYQVIPPSWKILEDGTRAEYRMISSIPPAKIKISKLVADLREIGITIGKKASRLEQNLEKLEKIGMADRRARLKNIDHEKLADEAKQAFDREINLLLQSVEGERNNQLNVAAFKTGKIIATGHLSEDEAIVALERAAYAIGLPFDEAQRTIRSGIESGKIAPPEVIVPKAVVPATDVDAEPTIKMIDDDAEHGAIGMYRDGCIRRMIRKNTPAGPVNEIEWVSDCALHIETETRSKTTTEFVFVGRGAVDGRDIKFCMPASELAEPKKFRAMVLDAFGAKNRPGKLSFEVVQEISLNPRLRERIEAPQWNENIPALPGVDLDDELEFKLSPMIPARVYDGDLQKAKEVLEKLLTLHPLAPIVVAAILGAPAVARWHPNDRFGLALWGLTGSLKTSFVQATMCIYGSSYLDEEFLLKHGKASATTNAMAEIFSAAGFLPQILDNVKTVSERDMQQYVEIIQAVMEGKEKQRGKKDGGLRDSRTFACTPIITGEIRPEEASTSARVLNLTWTRPERLQDLTDVQQNAALLPVIGYHWLRFLATTDLNLVEGFAEARAKKFAEFSAKNFTNPGRLATIYALLRAIWILAGFSPFGEIFGKFAKNFENALEFAIMEQGITVSEETEVQKFLNGLRELLASDPDLVMERDSVERHAGKPIIGKMVEDGLFLLPETTLAALMKQKVFTQIPSVDSMTKALVQIGALIRGDGKHLKAKVRINGQRVRGWLIKLEAIFPSDGPLLGPDDPTKNIPMGPQNRYEEGHCPTGTTFPTEKERENFEENKKFDDNYIFKSIEKSGRFFDDLSNRNDNTGGTGGTSGTYTYNIHTINSTDIDIHTNNIVPPDVPSDDDGGSTKKGDAEKMEQVKVRIVAKDGYRTQVEDIKEKFKYVDKLYNCDDVVMLPRWRAKNLVERGIAEYVEDDGN